MSLEAVVKKLRQQKFWHDRNATTPLLIALIINVINWPYLYFQMRHSGQLVPLRYNILNGVGAIGHWTKLFALPFYAILIFIFNGLLIYKFYQKEDRFILRLLLITQIATQLIFLLALILITNL
ncbi:MAG: hypothetical protein PHV78_01095 [Patescibacteria group bacterium]|nr:hypothetical protein [Patescibacteria group bacterium]MDD5121242.1 hypothetical protein [Patescibacteria group bacterium]MDD5222097.1 hypothetical protein [Patescibacteria group bacterium]MDD5395839.1 hypothetical protein [Patescibacteria group bacterium]